MRVSPVFALTFLLVGFHAHAVRQVAMAFDDEEASDEAAREPQGSLLAVDEAVDLSGEAEWISSNRWPFHNPNTGRVNELVRVVNHNARVTNHNIRRINGLSRQTWSNGRNIRANTNRINNVARNAAHNTQRINNVASNVASNTGKINQLGGQVSSNAARIAQNSNAIGRVGSGVARNQHMIRNVAANTAANTQAIGRVASHAAANTNKINQVGRLAVWNAHGVAKNANAIRELGVGVSANAQAITGLTANMAMLSGSVASNTAQIAGLTSQVAVLSQAAAPTVALANMLGVSVQTVSTLSLAGSFAGPLIGVMALVYVAWPAEESDPWLKMESRVAQLVNDKFNEERRKRLSNRLKRYLKEFARCAQGWVTKAMPSNEPVQSMLQVAMKNASGEELEIDGEGLEGNATSQEAPQCMAQLEVHMALERDEWLSTEADSLSSLVMPFANVHTQLLELLADYSPMDDQKMWGIQAEQTSAEYASFILEAILKAWKAHVCRTMRLRYSIKRYVSDVLNYWRYQLVVLTPVWQPHAAETCKDKCGGKSGWCNFCGGKNVGACCIRGGTQSDSPEDPSECQQFDPPFSNSFPYSPYHACMHTDCFQSNTKYYADTELSFGPADPRLLAADATRCQESCQTIPESAAFTFDPNKESPCICYGANASLSRYYKKGVTSGPTVCPSPKYHGASQEEEDKEETPHVPMEQIFPCTKSPRVRTLSELEHTHTSWMEECYANASKATVAEFNPFYRRFATFVERLAIQAGCGSFAVDPGHNQTDRVLADWTEEDWTNVSSPVDFFEGGSFSECDWEREEQRDDGKWIHDADKKQGWTGTSKIDMDEQRKLQMRYPLPAWLQRLLNFEHCLDYASGSDGSDDDKKAAAENMIMQRS